MKKTINKIQCCRTENNICVVGAFQEHHDLIYLDSCKNTEFSHHEICNNQQHPLTFEYKEDLNSNLVKMFLCNTSPPSSLSSGFPNKVVTLPQQLVSLLACHVANSMSLDWVRVHVCAKSLQSCPTVCNPIDCSPPGSSVHGIL